MITKKAQEMARIQFEDFSGVMDGIIFPATYEKFRHLIQLDQIVAMSGRLSLKEDSAPELMVDNITTVPEIQKLTRRKSFQSYSNRIPYARRENAGNSSANPSRIYGNSVVPPDYVPEAARNSSLDNFVKLRVPPEYIERLGGRNPVLEEIMGLLGKYPGDRDVLVYLPGGGKVRTSKEYRVTYSRELERELRDLLGNENVKG